MSDADHTERDERRAAEARRSRNIVAACIFVAGVILLLVYLDSESTHGPFVPEPFIMRELLQASREAPDANLLRVDAFYVNEKGEVQAAFSRDKYWDRGGHYVMTFRSFQQVAAPAQKQVALGAPAQPANIAPPPAACRELRVSAGLHGSGKQNSFGMENTWKDVTTCDTPLLTNPPRCSLAKVWQRAITAGAPHPAFADISLTRANASAAPKWHFVIADHAREDAVVFSNYQEDDCP